MLIFMCIEAVISLDLSWTIILENNQKNYGFLIGGMGLHYTNFLLKCILKNKNIYTWYYCLGILISESISLGLLNLSQNNKEGLIEILVLIQCASFYNQDLFQVPSVFAMVYFLILEVFKHIDFTLLLIKASVVFCLFLLASYFVRSVENKSTKNIEQEVKLIDVSIKSQGDSTNILEQMPWLTEQKFFVLNEKMSIIYQQVKLESLLDRLMEINSSYNENNWIETLLSSKCEKISKNLNSIFCSEPQQNQDYSFLDLRQICQAILQINNSEKQFYCVGDLDNKYLKFSVYRINIISLFHNKEKVLVLQIELELEIKKNNKKYFKTTSIKQNNSQTSRKSTQKNSTQNSVISNIFKSVSHEFGTYLNCIMSVSEEAISNKSISQETKNIYFEPIFMSSQLLSFILMNIRDYNSILIKQFVLRLQEFNPKEKINEIISLMNKQLECRQNKIEVICPDDLIIHNDGERYAQIVYQLLSNAIRFTNEGLIIIKVTTLNTCQIETMIIDNGIGMTISEKTKLEEMLQDQTNFQKISKNSVGCGLGLTISNIIAQKMSGKKGIQFNSVEDQGSTFKFYITDSSQLYNESYFQASQTYVKIVNQTYYMEQPTSFYTSIKDIEINSQNKKTMPISALSQQLQFRHGAEYHRLNLKDEQAMDDESNSFRERSKNKDIIIPTMSTNLKTSILIYSISSKCCRRVLLVDDEIFNITSLQLILQKFDIKADQALNGVEALKKCEEKQFSPCKKCQCFGYAVIFLDLNMPIMDGFDTVKELKRRMNQGQIPKALCIANTGFADLETKQQALAAGMDFYLTKPLETKVLENYLKTKFPLSLLIQN